MNQREFFDLQADTWDADRDPEQIKKIGELIQSINISADESILDVGAGTGILFPYINNKAYCAIDISFNMLLKAHENNPNQHILIQADVAFLPFTHECFDHAVLFAVFPHINQKAEALADLYRVLKQGGRIDIIHAASRDTINSFHHEHGGAITHDLIPDNTSMHELLSKTGFKDIHIQDLPDRYHTYATK
jgi:ubiquinone/menaquinone biosynthesis C-methylase UbiE